MPFEIFIEIYLRDSFLCVVIRHFYNYSFLITIASQFPICSPRSVGLGSEFFCCWNFWKQPSLSALIKWQSPFQKLFQGVPGSFPGKAFLEELFFREHVSLWFCKNKRHSRVISGNFRIKKKQNARLKPVVCRPAIY